MELKKNTFYYCKPMKAYMFITKLTDTKVTFITTEEPKVEHGHKYGTFTVSKQDFIMLTKMENQYS